MKRFGSIYLITNSQNGKKYVGQTTRSIESRFCDHARDKRSSRYLSSAIIKHGVQNFIIEELVVAFDEKTLNELETYYINKYNTLHPNGYNLSLGGHQRGNISDLTRKKMSDSKLGKSVKRLKSWSEKSRLNKSTSQNGKPIVAINVFDNTIKHYDFINQATKDGFSNGDIYRVLKGKRKTCKNHIFMYLSDYANQSGSSENKNSEHAQRIEIETEKSE